MIDTLTLITLLMMAGVTYFTRVAGYLLVQNIDLTPRFQRVLEAAPGCVLIAVISPHFVSGNPADLIALIITILVAIRYGLLRTVVVAILSAGVLRYVWS